MPAPKPLEALIIDQIAYKNNQLFRDFFRLDELHRPYLQTSPITDEDLKRFADIMPAQHSNLSRDLQEKIYLHARDTVLGMKHIEKEQTDLISHILAIKAKNRSVKSPFPHAPLIKETLCDPDFKWETVKKSTRDTHIRPTFTDFFSALFAIGVQISLDDFLPRVNVNEQNIVKKSYLWALNERKMLDPADLGDVEFSADEFYVTWDLDNFTLCHAIIQRANQKNQAVCVNFEFQKLKIRSWKNVGIDETEKRYDTLAPQMKREDDQRLHLSNKFETFVEILKRDFLNLEKSLLRHQFIAARAKKALIDNPEIEYSDLENQIGLHLLPTTVSETERKKITDTLKQWHAVCRHNRRKIISFIQKLKTLTLKNIALNLTGAFDNCHHDGNIMYAKLLDSLNISNAMWYEHLKTLREANIKKLLSTTYCRDYFFKKLKNILQDKAYRRANIFVTSKNRNQTWYRCNLVEFFTALAETDNSELLDLLIKKSDFMDGNNPSLKIIDMLKIAIDHAKSHTYVTKLIELLPPVQDHPRAVELLADKLQISSPEKTSNKPEETAAYLKLLDQLLDASLLKLIKDSILFSHRTSLFVSLAVFSYKENFPSLFRKLWPAISELSQLDTLVQLRKGGFRLNSAELILRGLPYIEDRIQRSARLVPQTNATDLKKRKNAVDVTETHAADNLPQPAKASRVTPLPAMISNGFFPAAPQAAKPAAAQIQHKRDFTTLSHSELIDELGPILRTADTKNQEIKKLKQQLAITSIAPLPNLSTMTHQQTIDAYVKLKNMENKLDTEIEQLRAELAKQAEVTPQPPAPQAYRLG